MRLFYTTVLLLGLVCGSQATQAQTSNTQTLTLQPNAQDGKDASIAMESMFAANNGIDENFICNAWTSSGSGLTQRSLIQFNLTSIPTNATITSAQLYLYGNPTSGHTQRHSWFPGTGWNINNAKLYRVTSAWSELNVTWNNQPTTTTTNAVTIAPSTSQLEDYILTVTPMVQDMVMSPATSHGFMIKLDNETTYRSLIFASSDHPQAALRPKLVVQYSVPQSVVDVNAANSVSVFPNPASELVSIKLAGAFVNGVEVKCVDAFGKVVRKIKGKGESVSFEINGLSAGVYGLLIQAESGERFTDRVIVR